MDQSEAPRFTFALKRGAILAGRYRIERLLADSSSFALTYLATDTSFSDDAPVTVAIKEFLPRVLVGRGRDGSMIQPHSPADGREFARALRRFRHEGEVLGDIDSPHIVRVHGCFEANGTAYLVMAPREGRTLPIALADAAGGCIPSMDAVPIVLRLLEVLEQIHAEGVLHRAIAPQSISMTDAWEPVLHGFSARRHVSGEVPEIIPGFAAFEQYGSGDVGPWTDVYACAAVLYHLVTGVMPPPAIDRAAGKPLAHASWLAPDVSSDLSQVIARGLSLLPEQRPHGAVEFRKELERALTEAQEASSPFVSFELEPTGDEGLPPIEDEFGPEELVEQQQTAMVVQELPREKVSKPGFTELLGKIAKRVRGRLRNGSIVLSLPKRQRVDVQSNDAEPTDLMGVQASAPRGVYKRAVVRTITAAVLTLAVLRSAFWIVGQYRDSNAPKIGLTTASADTRTASTRDSNRRRMLDASGAVQQAGTVREDSAPAKAATPATATSRKEPEPTEESPSLPSLPKVKGVSLGASIDSNRDLVPVDVMLDLRTQLANGKQQAEDGEYVLARRILGAAATSADAALGRFAGSKSLRSIRAELDSTDRRVLAACRAENDIIRKRGGSEKPCQ